MQTLHVFAANSGVEMTLKVLEDAFLDSLQMNPADILVDVMLNASVLLMFQ